MRWYFVSPITEKAISVSAFVVEYRIQTARRFVYVRRTRYVSVDVLLCGYGILCGRFRI